MLKEKRYLKIDDKQFHSRIQTDESGKRFIIGYGSVFNYKSKIITEYVASEREYRSFYEVIETGAFDRVLSSNPQVVITVDHDFSKMLGRTSSGTLKLSVDEKGLRYEVEVPNTTLGNDVAELVNRGDMFESSFMFTIDSKNERWEKDNETGIWTRYISEVSGLYDVTLCNYAGAYSGTDIEVAQRNLDDVMKSTIELDEQELQKERNEKLKLETEIFLLQNEI